MPVEPNPSLRCSTSLCGNTAVYARNSLPDWSADETERKCAVCFERNRHHIAPYNRSVRWDDWYVLPRPENSQSENPEQMNPIQPKTDKPETSPMLTDPKPHVRETDSR